jgi:hypothetical protein
MNFLLVAFSQPFEMQKRSITSLRQIFGELARFPLKSFCICSSRQRVMLSLWRGSLRCTSVEDKGQRPNHCSDQDSEQRKQDIVV